MQEMAKTFNMQCPFTSTVVSCLPRTSIKTAVFKPVPAETRKCANTK